MDASQLDMKAKAIKCLDGILSVSKQSPYIIVSLSKKGKIYKGNATQVEAFLAGLEFCCQNAVDTLVDG
jgi:hypothetical protein